MPPAVAKSKNDREEIANETEGARQCDIEFIPFDDKADLTGALTGRLTKIDKADSTGALTGDDYDIMLHCTIGHMRRVDGALPDFNDGTKALDLFAPAGEHRFTTCIFCILCIFCIFMLFSSGIVCARHNQYMGSGTIS